MDIKTLITKASESVFKKFVNKAICRHLGCPDGDFDIISADPILYEITRAVAEAVCDLANNSFSSMVDDGLVTLTDKYYKAVNEDKSQNKSSSQNSKLKTQNSK